MGPHMLVTGGAGFIGSNFIRMVLRERPHARVTNLDVLSYAGNLENLADVQGSPRYRFVHGDVCDAALVSRLVADADAIVHFAAESHVDRSIQDTRPFLLSNTLGTHALLECVRRAPRSRGGRIVCVSTDEVYGSLPLGRSRRRFRENSPLAPSSPYAASKAGADMLALAWHRTFGLDAVITRCSNNFGPFQFPEKVIPLFVTNLIDGRPVPLYGEGKNVRDWIHVDDHCEALLAVLERGRAGEVYNIGADNERCNLELTRAILRIMGLGEDMVRRVPDRPGHDLRYSIDASKIRDELGWKPTRSAWPAALERTIRWYRENEGWWRRVRSGAYRAFAPAHPAFRRAV
jgi:dTDP-glucose 4,6-dehydratase